MKLPLECPGVYSVSLIDVSNFSVGKQGMGAVFDLPEDVAKELLALPLPPGDEIQAISKVSS